MDQDENNIEMITPEESLVDHPPAYKNIVLALLILVFAGSLVAYIHYGMNNTPYEQPEEVAEEPVTVEVDSTEEKLRLLESLSNTVEGDEGVSFDERKALLEELSLPLEDEGEEVGVSADEKERLLNSLQVVDEAYDETN